METPRCFSSLVCGAAAVSPRVMEQEMMLRSEVHIGGRRG